MIWTRKKPGQSTAWDDYLRGKAPPQRMDANGQPKKLSLAELDQMFTWTDKGYRIWAPGQRPKHGRKARRGEIRRRMCKLGRR